MQSVSTLCGKEDFELRIEPVFFPLGQMVRMSGLPVLTF